MLPQEHRVCGHEDTYWKAQLEPVYRRVGERVAEKCREEAGAGSWGLGVRVYQASCMLICRHSATREGSPSSGHVTPVPSFHKDITSSEKEEMVPRSSSRV